MKGHEVSGYYGDNWVEYFWLARGLHLACALTVIGLSGFALANFNTFSEVVQDFADEHSKTPRDAAFWTNLILWVSPVLAAGAVYKNLNLFWTGKAYKPLSSDIAEKARTRLIY